MNTALDAFEPSEYTAFVTAIQELIEKTNALAFLGRARPELDPHEGDPIVVNTQGRRENASVTKIGRSYVTAQPAGGGREWRFRLDTQNEGHSHGTGGASFRTPAQIAYDDHLTAAERGQREHGFDLRWHTRPVPSVILAVAAVLAALDRAGA